METFDFGRKKVVSVIFDLSIAHENGVRIIDLIKKQLVDLVVEKDEELLFFVTSRENNFPIGCGSSIQQIDSYCEPPDFSICHAIRKAIINNVKSVEDVDKVILLITDRFDKKYNGHYKSMLDAKKYNKYDYDICFIEVNNQSQSLKTIAEVNGGKYEAISNTQNFLNALKKVGVA